MPIFVKFGAELLSQFYLNRSLHYSVLANGPAASYTNRQKWQKIKRRKEKKGMKRNCFRWKSIPTATMKTQEIINCQTVTFKMTLHLLHSPYMTSVNEMSNLKPLTLIRPELLNLCVRIPHGLPRIFRRGRGPSRHFQEPMSLCWLQPRLISQKLPSSKASPSRLRYTYMF